VVGGFALITTTVVGSSTASFSSGEPISLEEREALIAFYESTDGNHWKHHDGWLGPAGSQCEWYGVECESVESEHANVVGLNLSENNIHGTIPEALGQLGHLQTLFPFGNDLSGRLPAPLIPKWLAGSLWVNASAPQFTDVEVIEYAGGGPAELWTINMAIEGGSSSIEWEKAQSLAACPAWEKGQVAASK
jgi:hypothetical protein